VILGLLCDFAKNHPPYIATPREIPKTLDELLNLRAARLQPGDEQTQKAEYVRNLGAERVVAIGQGANDAGMLKTATLGICVLSLEGVAVETLLSADLLMPDILSALDLFDKPLRLIASLRK
jgi:soluble P-type ATPase